MGFVDRLKIMREVKRRDISLKQFGEMADAQMFGGLKTNTGMIVTPEIALNYSAVWNAVTVLAGTIASLPLMVFKRIGIDGRERFANHRLFDTIHTQPNPEMTSFLWREVAMNHVLLWGNHYSFIENISEMGAKINIWPLNPQRVEPFRNEGGKLVYKYRRMDNKEVIIPAEKMFHLAGLGFDGRVGYSVISKAAESFSLGLSMESFGSRYFGQGTHLGGLITHPGRLSPEAKTNLKESFDNVYKGLTGSHTTGVLEEGMKYEAFGIPPNDSQFLESRVFQVTEVARWFNLPPHKIKDLTRSTFSNIESSQIEFVTDSIRPWLVRWEQTIGWKLLTIPDRRNVFAEFVIEGLLRGDIQTRFAAYAIARANGFMTADQVRARENMNPTEDGSGKIYNIPLNWTNAADLLLPPEEPEDEPFDEEPEEEEENVLMLDIEKRGHSKITVRSVRLRRKLGVAFKPRFFRAIQRIVAKEIIKVLSIAKKTLQERTQGEFNAQIDEWYLSEPVREFIESELGSVYESYADEIYKVAADEINSKLEADESFRLEVQKYIENSTTRYIMASRGQIKSVVRRAIEDGIDEIEAVEKRLAEWTAKRPEKEARREIIAGAAGLASFVYFAGGFRVVWVTVGKNCPYCDSLDGATIASGEFFLDKGIQFQPEGAERPLTTRGGIGHPPAHGSCDCSTGPA